MGPLKVFVVTGGNKGIGKSIVKLLLQDKSEKIVYLTARNEELGKSAVRELNDSFGLKAKFHQLDITNTSSINRLRNYLVENYGGLDVLVNNAGIAFRGTSAQEGATETVGCNYFSTLNIVQILMPFLKDGGSVVNVSSISGVNAFNRLGHYLKIKLRSSKLTVSELSQMMNDFIEATKNEGSFNQSGWPTSSYGISKMGVNFLTQLLQRNFDSEEPKRNLRVNSCCPGLVETDMTRGKHPKESYLTPDQGAQTPVYLALLPTSNTTVKGCFYKLKENVSFPPS